VWSSLYPCADYEINFTNLTDYTFYDPAYAPTSDLNTIDVCVKDDLEHDSIYITPDANLGYTLA